MKTVLGYIFLIFSGMVLFNYLSTQLGSFWSFLPQQLAQADQRNSTGLTSVNFNVFDKGGVGSSYITQGYGRTPYSYMYIDGWHNGIDIAATYGAPIYSPAAGTVLAIGNQDNYCPRIAFGKFVVVDDTTNHLIFLFAHLGTIGVSSGETIDKDAEIGTVGVSGLETGPHLHVSIFKEVGFSMAPAHGCGPYPDGHDVDPLDYLGTTYK